MIYEVYYSMPIIVCHSNNDMFIHSAGKPD